MGDKMLEFIEKKQNLMVDNHFYELTTVSYLNNINTLHIQASIDNEILIVKLTGVLNYKTQRSFREYCYIRINQILDMVTYLQFDFSALSQIDSTGLGALLLMQRNLKKEIPTEIINCNPNIYHAFEISQFIKFFKVSKSTWCYLTKKFTR